MHAHYHLTEELLLKFGLTEQTELEMLKDFISSTFKTGNELLKNGLSTLFNGMDNAVSVYSKLKEEVDLLNEGIVSLKNAAHEAREHTLLAETMAAQRCEVKLILVLNSL
jgi:hypothetical protein